MLNEFINFETISRKEWQRLHKEDNAPLTAEELDSIRSLNDKIDVQEVSDIYLPLINLIRIYQKIRLFIMVLMVICNTDSSMSMARGVYF